MGSKIQDLNQAIKEESKLLKKRTRILKSAQDKVDISELTIANCRLELKLLERDKNK
jgi:hypothetical protein